MSMIWAGALVFFIVAEVATVNLVTIWFAVGSVAGLIAAALGAPLWLQITLFVVVSAAVLAFVRPLAKKYINSQKKPTNADRVLGAVCPVVEDIDNVDGKGAVKVDGKTWSARTANGEKIPAGAFVRPVSIQGVKLIVERAETPAEKV